MDNGMDEPKDGILIVFNDAGKNLVKARFSTVGSLFSDSLLCTGKVLYQGLQNIQNLLGLSRVQN